MAYVVAVMTVRARSTAVVVRKTSWAEFPRIWRPMLDQVYAVLKAAGKLSAGHNIMLYRDDQPTVEVGVQLAAPFSDAGGVVSSCLPAGEIASTLHRGPYEGLGAAHQAVLAWCAAQGRALAGPRWEIYGDWRDNPADLETEVCYLLQ